MQPPLEGGRGKGWGKGRNALDMGLVRSLHHVARRPAAALSSHASVSPLSPQIPASVLEDIVSKKPWAFSLMSPLVAYIGPALRRCSDGQVSDRVQTIADDLVCDDIVTWHHGTMVPSYHVSLVLHYA